MDSDERFESIDAATFQKPLKQLAEVLAQKVLREGPKFLPPHRSLLRSTCTC
jgi:hypothetical protein